MTGTNLAPWAWFPEANLQTSVTYMLYELFSSVRPLVGAAFFPCEVQGASLSAVPQTWTQGT